MADYEAEGRPRTRTMMSSDSKKSHKSRKSDGSWKMDLTESPKDKLRIHGKADPSRALTELQPAAEAVQPPTLADLRGASYTGRDGHMIQEPDASNPTRSKWESPLQTIRGFEEDISRTYREKQMAHPASVYRPQSRSDMYSRVESRRSSYMSGYNQQSQFGGYYRGYENEEPMSQAGHVNPYGQRMSRGWTDSMYSRAEPPQPPYHNHTYSRDAATASPETDQNGYSTGPSSWNSSYDQLGSPVQTKQLPQPPAPGAEMYSQPMGPPGVQPHAAQPIQPRVPMKLNTGVDSNGGYGDFSKTQKRQSWFKRRFSKEY